jgi:glycosyltransferase involved in cell wall biosynthesis
MRILALEPYYGGSHEAFLTGWTRRSRHDWTLLTLPANHWKWRMRHAAVTLARMTHEKSRAGEQWDLIFFDAVETLHTRGVEFRLDVVGQQFRSRPSVFDRAKQLLADRIGRWGYQHSRAEYQAALAEADVIVSTARHEFFGISVCEAIAAGAYPVLPRRLAYPELLGDAGDEFFYDGGADVLADRLADLARRVEDGQLWQGGANRAARAVERFHWTTLAPQLDDGIDGVAEMR